jgi:CRP-like cAMP-binding protein
MADHPALRQHFERLISLSDAEWAEISACFTPRKLRKHQFLVQEGERVVNDYFVLSGCLKAYHLDTEGREHILQFAVEDWWVTDYQAYFGGAPATIYVDCVEPSEVLALSLEHREQLCARFHQVEHFFRKKSNAGYVALQQRILSLLTSSPKERYEQLLTMSPHLLQRLPKTLIAAYLGVSREALSRLNK